VSTKSGQLQTLAAVLESQALERARDAVESALGVRHPGRRAKPAQLAIGAKPRKKPPVQFCPVPGCKNPAAPVYGMVCAKHRGVPKAKIKKYREARKAKRLGARPEKATKRLARRTARPKALAAAKPGVVPASPA
jgi:hypothetical protein